MIQFRQCEFASDSTKRFCRNSAIVSPQLSRRVTPDQCQSCRFAGDGFVDLSEPVAPPKAPRSIKSVGPTDRRLNAPVQNRSVKPKLTKNGPGSELKRIFSDMGFPPCQQCYDLAVQMDKWGVEGCREHLSEIIEHILPRARGWLNDKRPAKYAQALLGKKLVASLGDFALREAIKIPVLNAINEAEKKRIERTT